MDDQLFISIGEAHRVTGISKATLRVMADNETIRSYKTPSGQRKFHKPTLDQMCSSIQSYSQPATVITKQNFLYSRVSSKKQLDDLQRQSSFLQGFRPEYIHYKSLSDVGSGINFQRKGLLTILDSCLQKTIGEVVIAHKDRLCRFGYELIEQLIKKSGGKITVLDQGEKHPSTEEELASDLLSIIHIYSCRQMGRRK
jgi:putative resolvase